MTRMEVAAAITAALPAPALVLVFILLACGLWW
jgi:hypothetical protein